MAGTFAKVRPGQPLRIPAAEFNAFLDAAKAHKARQHEIAAQVESGFRDHDILPMRNSTGEPRERFDVLGLDRPVFGPAENLEEFKSRPAMRGVVPSSPIHHGKFAVLQEPLVEDAIGRGCVDGVTVARVRITDPLIDRVDVAAGVCDYLETAPDGSALVLWREGGLGIQWALVRLGLPCCKEPSSEEPPSDGSDSDGSISGSGSDSGSPPISDDESQSDDSEGSGPTVDISGSDETGSDDTEGSGSSISIGSGSSESSASSFECGVCFCGHIWDGTQWHEVLNLCGDPAVCPDTEPCSPIAPPFFDGPYPGFCFGNPCPQGTVTLPGGGHGGGGGEEGGGPL